MKKLGKVLHVDDDQDIRAITKISLELIGKLTVKQYSNGPDAILGVQDFNPDLLLLDLMIPGMDGQQIFEAIRNLDGLETIPAVFMTAKAQQETVSGLIAKGSLGVITKPFDPVELPSLLEKEWQNWHYGKLL